jgi:hypothetical protein
MTRGHLARIGLLTVALLLTACTLGTNEAKEGVEEFRARVAQRSFSEIYQSSAPEFRQASTEEQFVNFMTALDGKLGPWQSGADAGWNVMRGVGGHSVRLRYDSRFAKGTAVEDFAWRIERGRPVLLGYHVQSPLLARE